MVQKQKLSFGRVQPLERARYDLLGDVGRCLHTDDVQEAHAKGHLVPQWLRNSSVRLRQKVLWFAPCKSLDEHNEFGSATFVINWQRVVSELGPYLYLIDQAIYNNRAYTRVVFTRNQYDSALCRVDLHVQTSPIKYEFDSYYHVSSCQCKNTVGPHELQIAIEVSDVDAAWLLRNCSVRGNNHSSANTLMKHVVARHDGQPKKYVSYKCFKYNTAQNRECPNDFDRAGSDALLAAMGFITKTGDSQTKQLYKFSDDVRNRANKENSLPHVHLGSQKVTPQPRITINQPADFHGRDHSNFTPLDYVHPKPASSTKSPQHQTLYSENHPNSTREINSLIHDWTRASLTPHLDESRAHIDRVPQVVVSRPSVITSAPRPGHRTDHATTDQDNCCAQECDPCFSCFCR